MKTWYKNKIVIAVIVLGLLLIGWFTLPEKQETVVESGNNASSALEKTEGGVRVVGDIACLPYRNANKNDGCVKGIKDDEGRYYAINSFAIKGAENSIPLGTRVVAIGSYEPADTSNSESSIFSYSGVLVVTSLKRE